MGSDDGAAGHMDRNLTRPDLNQPIRRVERGKGCKRDNSHLVEKAPVTDSGVKKHDTESKGRFFDCNICLEIAKEPVLTCFGHLFCCACFYQVSNVCSLSKECPVCKVKVSDTAVTPIYGNGESEGIRVTESGLLISPSPKGRKVESVRQRVTQPSGDVQTSQQSGGVQAESVSLSFLPSSFSNAGRFVEYLESVINNQMLGNETLADVGSDSSRSSNVSGENKNS